jgi:hypothetical protein
MMIKRITFLLLALTGLFTPRAIAQNYADSIRIRSVSLIATKFSVKDSTMKKVVFEVAPSCHGNIKIGDLGSYHDARKIIIFTTASMLNIVFDRPKGHGVFRLNIPPGQILLSGEAPEYPDFSFPENAQIRQIHKVSGFKERLYNLFNSQFPLGYRANLSEDDIVTLISPFVKFYHNPDHHLNGEIAYFVTFSTHDMHPTYKITCKLRENMDQDTEYDEAGPEVHDKAGNAVSNFALMIDR